MWSQAVGGGSWQAEESLRDDEEWGETTWERDIKENKYTHHCTVSWRCGNDVRVCSAWQYDCNQRTYVGIHVHVHDIVAMIFLAFGAYLVMVGLAVAAIYMYQGCI